MTIVTYDHCATCGHLGASHASDGHCLAWARGDAPRTMPKPCPCEAFVPPSNESVGKGEVVWPR